VSQERIIVIGAGLSGLAVGARLVSSGREVLVLEASERSGGQIHTHREPGLLVELGAEGFIARSRAVPELCRLVGTEGELIDQLTTDTYALDDGRLVLLPPGEAARRLGFQVPAEELGRGIRSLARGMGQLTDALAERLAERLRLRTAVRTVSRHRDRELVLELADGTELVTRSLVLSTPARLAAEILVPLALPEVARLGTAPVMSNVSVNLSYRREQLGSCPAGSGVIFPEALADVGLRAFSVVDHKFAGRAGPADRLLRVFFRPQPSALTEWDDARFAAEAAKAIGQVLDVSGEPTRSWVSRWLGALPVHTPEHRARVDSADAALQQLGIHLTGSAYHGAGIDAAVSSAERVAQRLLS
jgi:protoporphyrinogen/coproporphyrinogen III oxidase